MKRYRLVVSKLNTSFFLLRFEASTSRSSFLDQVLPGLVILKLTPILWLLTNALKRNEAILFKLKEFYHMSKLSIMQKTV